MAARAPDQAAGLFAAPATRSMPPPAIGEAVELQGQCQRGTCRRAGCSLARAGHWSLLWGRLRPGSHTVGRRRRDQNRPLALTVSDLTRLIADGARPTGPPLLAWQPAKAASSRSSEPSPAAAPSPCPARSSRRRARPRRRRVGIGIEGATLLSFALDTANCYGPAPSGWSGPADYPVGATHYEN